jgi:FrmR/RcnR family transcriptional regulator, repressor of rcnA expression
MAHVTLHRRKLLTRIRRIAGQVGALEKLLQDDVECAAVLTQIAAVRGAVHGLMLEVLEDHLREHVVAEPRRGSRAREMAAVASLIRTYLK